MIRRWRGGRLVIASHNPGKLREIAGLLAPFEVETVSAASLGLPEPEETGTSFAANASLKARAAVEGTGSAALADDSGLCVTALNGAPGIYSARWAGPGKDFGVAMAKIEQELAGCGTTDRRATFVCALTLAWPDGAQATFEGRVEGHLVWPPRGTLGFGYDPMFVPEGYDITFGEMDPAAKNAITHRALAFNKLVAAVFNRDS